MVEGALGDQARSYLTDLVDYIPYFYLRRAHQIKPSPAQLEIVLKILGVKDESLGRERLSNHLKCPLERCSLREIRDIWASLFGVNCRKSVASLHVQRTHVK